MRGLVCSSGWAHLTTDLSPYNLQQAIQLQRLKEHLDEEVEYHAKAIREHEVRKVWSV